MAGTPSLLIPSHGSTTACPVSSPSSYSSFKPTSYTRAFFNSPISWCPGSFDNSNRHFPGSSPNQLHSSLDPVDLRDAGKVESDRGYTMDPLSAMEREGEFCRNYTCCGLDLQDLHALLEHYEEYHVVVDRRSHLVSGQPYPHTAPSASSTHDSYITHSAQIPHPQERPQQPRPQLRPQYQRSQQQHHQGPFHPDDMELDVNSSPASSSPSSTPVSPVIAPFVPYTTQRAFTTASSFTPSLSQPSPGCPVSAFDNATVLPSRALTSAMPTFSLTQRDSFNIYPAYSDYGAAASPLQASQENTSASSSQPDSTCCCISPTLLYSPSSITPANTPSGSSVASLAKQGQTELSYYPPSLQASRSASSRHFSKPFRYPKLSHHKSCEHLNALRYHVPHGHCNFSPPEGSEAPRVLVAKKGTISVYESSGLQVTEGGLPETERRLRPFAFGIDNCQRRYMGMKCPRRYYQHSSDRDIIGLQLLATEQHECLQQSKTAAATCQTTLPQGLDPGDIVESRPSPTQELVPASPPVLTPPDNMTSDSMRELLPNDWQCMKAVSTPPFPIQEHIIASPPTPSHKLLSDHVYESSTDDRKCANATSTSSSSQQVPTSQSPPFRFLTPPYKLHPTLFTWIKNMNKLSSLIGRLQELTFFVPAEHRSRLSNQVVALRVTSKRQQEHFIEFLQLSEEYANKYLFDISAEIHQQSTILDNLQEHLEAAEKLHVEAVNLQMLYESETVAAMERFRAIVSRPFSEDQALFSEVDSVITDIRQCYMELDKFWTEEVSRVVEALKMRRVVSTDFERWKTFHANLKRTIESWKDELPCRDAQTLHRNKACSSEEADIGVIAASLSSAMCLLKSALERVPSSDSLKHSLSGQSSFQQVYVAFAANSDVCLSFLRQCADYGDRMRAVCLPSMASATSSPSHVDAPYELRERIMRLRSEMEGVSTENVTRIKGSRKFKAIYKKALSLEQKMTSGLNAMVEKLSSWVMITHSHGLHGDALSDVITLEQVHELLVKARDSMGTTLATLKNEPDTQLFYRSAPPVATKRLSAMKRWLLNLV